MNLEHEEPFELWNCATGLNLLGLGVGLIPGAGVLGSLIAGTAAELGTVSFACGAVSS